MEKISTALETLGLTDKETRVYLACLELGSATIQELAGKSGVKRTSIYNFLEGMKKKGLISEVKQDTRLLLIPESPEALLERAKKQVSSIETIMPELASIFNRPGSKPKIKFYPGTEGIKKAYDDILITAEPIVAFSDYEKMLSSMDEEYMWVWARERAKRGIKFACIAQRGPKADQIVATAKEQLREIKVIDKINFETEINIYGNKVALMSFRQPCVAVIIEDVAIAQTLRSVWQLLWNNLP